MRNSILTTAALVALVALPMGVSAQNFASVTATAAVQTPISVTASGSIAFGDVLPGVPVSVLPAAGGQFAVAGEADEDVVLDFDLPATLNDGALTLPVSFDAGYGAAAPDNAIADPSLDPTVNLGGTGAFIVFVGGTVTPAVSQAAGSYSGTVTLTVTYPGS